MNITELVTGKLPEIKKLLFSEEAEPKVETTVEPATEEAVEMATESFEDAKLADGTIVRIEPAVEVGATVKVISEDGELTDAPDAEHEMESGAIVRTEGGLIVEIMEPEVEEEAKEEEEESKKEEEEYAAEAPAFDADAFKEDILGAVSNLIKSEIDAAAFASKKNVDEVTEAVTMVTDIIEKMAATPKEAPTKKVTNPFVKPDHFQMAEQIRKVMVESKKL